MNRRTVLEAGAGLLLCAVGFFLAHRESYDVHTVLATAAGCRMATDIYEPRSGTLAGSVVLFHGLAANKKVMAFNAQEFANQDLRVFVPDLPGHGRTPGPYSADRADSCALTLVRDLAARKAIIPERTILAGHSLGGAIAIRAAAQFPVAGVIALSPAPMQTAPGFSPEMIPFHNVPALPPHSLVLTGQWEPGSIKAMAQQLVSSSSDPSSKYRMIAHTSHVSILFSSETFSEIRSWTSQLLGADRAAALPKNLPALACLLGLAGLSLLAPPFMREMNSSAPQPAPHAATPVPRFFPGLGIIGVASLAAVLVLASTFIPFHFIHVFQGDYLGVFLFLTGAGALAGRGQLWPSRKALLDAPLAPAIASALVLVLLFAAWFEITFYEAWLTPARWLRFPVLFVLVLPWQFAEELFLGDCKKSPYLRRLSTALAFRAVAFLPLLLGILILHSGEILLFLLLAYFVVFSVLQRLACDLVRFGTRGPAPAAIFGAILLAAFALAIFPVA